MMGPPGGRIGSCKGIGTGMCGQKQMSHVDVDGPRPNSDLQESVSCKFAFGLSNLPEVLDLGLLPGSMCLDTDLGLKSLRGPDLGQCDSTLLELGIVCATRISCSINFYFHRKEEFFVPKS